MPRAPLTAHVAPGAYRHFRGGAYEVLSVGRHTETDELVVVYRSLADPDTVWVRPYEMFTDEVELPHGIFPRFQASEQWDDPKWRGLVWLAVESIAGLAQRLEPLARRGFSRRASG